MLLWKHRRNYAVHFTFDAWHVTLYNPHFARDTLHYALSIPELNGWTLHAAVFQFPPRTLHSTLCIFHFPLFFPCFIPEFTHQSVPRPLVCTQLFSSWPIRVPSILDGHGGNYVKVNAKPSDPAVKEEVLWSNWYAWYANFCLDPTMLWQQAILQVHVCSSLSGEFVPVIRKGDWLTLCVCIAVPGLHSCVSWFWSGVHWIFIWLFDPPTRGRSILPCNLSPTALARTFVNSNVDTQKWLHQTTSISTLLSMRQSHSTKCVGICVLQPSNLNSMFRCHLACGHQICGRFATKIFARFVSPQKFNRDLFGSCVARSEEGSGHVVHFFFVRFELEPVAANFIMRNSNKIS